MQNEIEIDHLVLFLWNLEPDYIVYFPNAPLIKQ